ncbi:hypothetical protein GCM10010168_07510 [Actinoplanes ianthinogenes]|uniref:LPXTG-motif cell wall-anchored protein n=1 Tax=Actinoplanes ianthinogenes TaxID=122358 RepID=A0ABM7LT83_9ACTN|nr:cell wall anchor protein [Actinoplanes ianthinogenes]BCJ42507.1 hypothetical protein Aiant_31640 [Actinoplanes ianthinogenes]GGQ94139.1 hypothetical protein GCM10010168_07510 [Actinoplanes ianthinogenes]
MKIKSTLRRTATLLAGAVVGLTGVVAIAAPASAHDAWVTGAAQCGTDGKNVVKWTLTNDYKTDATISNLQITAGGTAPVDANGHELTSGFVLPAAQHNHFGEAVFTQTFDSGTEVELSFTASWPQDGYTESTPNNKAKVQLKQGCTPPAPTCETNPPKFTHTFALVDGKWKSTVKLDATTRLCHDEPVTLVSYFTPQPNDKNGDNWPQYEYQSQTKTISDKESSVDLEVEAPDCNTQVDLFFGDKVITPMTKDGARYGDTKLGSKSGLGGRSTGPQGWYNGGGKACTTPAVAPVSSCTGDLTLNLSNNGKFGKYDVTFTVKYGNETKTVTVAAGKADTLTIPAGSGDVTVSAPGLEEKKYSWTRPEDCAPPAVTIQNDCTNVTVVIDNPKDVTPVTAKVTYGDETKTVTVKADSEEKATFKLTEAKFATVAFEGLKLEPLKVAVKDIECGTPSATPSASVSTTPVASDEPSLPVTGAAAGSIAGIAVLLLGGGVAMFFIARRRKTKFTA